MYLLWKKISHSFLFIINLWTTNLCSINTDTGTRDTGTQGHGTRGQGTQGHGDTGTRGHIFIFYIIMNYMIFCLQKQTT